MTSGQKRHYIVCKNITDIFRAEKALVRERVAVHAVPSPPREVGPCTTVLEIRQVDRDRAINALRADKIEVIKVIDVNTRRDDLIDRLTFSEPDKRYRLALASILRGDPPNVVDLTEVLAAKGENRRILWEAADRVRENTIGDFVDIRGALEFSNNCRRNCFYCGLRRDNKTIGRYRMSEDEMVGEALKISETGIRTIILQSGEDPWYTTSRIVDIIKRIKKETGLKITLSLGERQPEEYKMFREAGASNYLLKIETTDPGLYSSLHPETSFAERAAHVKMIKEAGFVTGSGNIIGLPGQDLKSIARDILWFYEEGIHMVGIGPFIPAPHTPLAQCNPGSVKLTLNTIAVTRLICNNAYIPSTTALASLDKEAQRKGLTCGANTVMLILTPSIYRDRYMIYGNKMMVDLEWALTMTESLQRKTRLSAERRRW